MLTAYTAYNRNTSDVVGLLVLELPPLFEAEAALRLLEPLEQRRRAQSPHVIHVYDWGIDGTRAYIATDPPRGVTLRHVLYFGSVRVVFKVPGMRDVPGLKDEAH